MNSHSVPIQHFPRCIVLDASNSEELSPAQFVFSTKLCTLMLKTVLNDSAPLSTIAID